MKADGSADGAAKVERLYRKYAGAMLRAAMAATDDRQLAEDAVQQTFEKVIGLADRIDEENERRTGGLLVLMCRQAVADLYESKMRTIGAQTLDHEAHGENPDMQQEDLLDLLLRKESMEELRQALRFLDPKYAEPLLLKYGAGLSGVEIAKVLGIEENLVNQRLHRAKQKVKEWLAGKGGDAL